MRLLIFIILLYGQFCYTQNYKSPETLNEYLNHSSIIVDEEYFHKEDYSLPVIISGIDSLIIKKINARLKEIFHDQVENGSLQDKLKSHLKKNVANYISIYGAASDTTQFFARNDLKPILKEKDYKFVRCGKNTLVFLVSFDYEAEIQNYSTYRDTEDFYSTYYEQLYFNLLTGTEYAASEIFDNSKIDELNKYLVSRGNDKIRTKYEFEGKIEKKAFLYRYQYDEEYEDTMVDSSIKRELTKFDIRNDVLLVPSWFSFQLHVPEFSSPTLGILGKPVTLRIKFDELKNFLNSTGPFGYLKQFEITTKTKLRNNVNPPFNYAYIYETDDLKIPYRDTTLSIQEETVFRKIEYANSERNKESQVIKKIIRLENGLIDKIVSYGNDNNSKYGILGESKFLYDNNMNLIKVENGRSQTTYHYDEFNNLLSRKSQGGDHEFEEFYTYFNDFYVKEQFQKGFNLRITREIRGYDNSQKPTRSYWGENSLQEYSYQYNDQGKKIGKIQGYYGIEKIFSSDSWHYDLDGKVLEFCYDNSRRWFFKYDNSGLLIEKANLMWGGTYENAKRKRFYEYDEKKRLKRIEVFDKNGNNRKFFYDIVYKER